MNFQRLLAISVSSIALALVWPKAQAAMITPISVQASSTFNSYNAINLINNSGLSNLTHDTDPTNMWLSNTGITATLTFDLGVNQQLSGAYFWQYYANDIGSSRGAKDISISTSVDGLSFSNVLTTQLNEANNASFTSVQFKAFEQIARYIKVDILSNHGSNFYSGLSEVKFESQGTFLNVPEPSLLTLLVLGLLAWFWLIWDSILNILVFNTKAFIPVRLYRRNTYSISPPDVTSKYQQLDKFLNKDQTRTPN